jgi:hypothetical protein
MKDWTVYMKFALFSLVWLVIPGFVCGTTFAADEFALLREERIGDLRIGLTEKDVQKAIHCSLKLGPDELWGSDGSYHQKWEYSACGVTLSMVSERKGAAKSIESITLISPSTLSTKRNIRIGSAKKEAVKAYKSYWNKEDSKLSGRFVAGSIYGGLMLTFEKDKVRSIFLGAVAE